MARPSNRILLLPILILSACTGEGDVDRTQPNRVPKSMFAGTWYVRSTVVGVPGTSAAAFVGQTGVMEKIRWDVQESHLLAYRAYEEIPGTDSGGKGHESGSNYKENPIAAFRIESHFDIKREYNPATGEQTNVISENSSDRPWSERDYIRVDWSKSEIDSQQFYGAAGSVPYSVSYFVQQNQGGEDAMRIVANDGANIDFDRLETVRDREANSWTGNINYFDMVGRFLLEPESVDYAGQKIPLCYFIKYAGRNYQTVTCGPAEVEVRTAFLRADERNFEPIPLNDRDFSKFGFFRTERFSYDRRYGFTETGRIYLANVHNIWDKAYETDATGVMSVGNDGKFTKIPLAARTPKPIVYHLNENYPCELVGAAQGVAASWNNSFRRSVAVAKGMLNRTDGNIDADLSQISREQVPEMFVLDTNGWVQKSPGNDWSCANLDRDETKVVARLGDLRYNFMAWVHDRQIEGPLGFGPSSADPETGEIIAGMAHVYGAGVDEYANRALEIVRALNGDLTVDDLVTAADVRAYIEASSVMIDPAKIPAEAAFVRGDELHQAFVGDKLAAKLDAVRAGGLEQATLGNTSRLGRIRGTEFENMLIDEEVIRGLAPTMMANMPIGPGDLLDPQLKQELSPLRLNEKQRTLDAVRRDEAAKRCIWLAEFSDDSIQGLAIELWKKHHRNGAQSEYDAIYEELRQLIFKGVMEHEVGHTVGLRHNFAGSYDSINFDKSWWDLRATPDSEGNGGLIERDPVADPAGLNLNQMYAQAKQNEAQKTQRMREMQYSSIMDYGAKFNADFHGIGKYDHAAIMFGYTGFVEVFDAPAASGAKVLRGRHEDCKPRFESVPNLAYTPLLEEWHYSSVWNFMGKSEGLAGRRFKSWDNMRAEQQAATEACGAHVAGGGTVADFQDNIDGNRDSEVPYMFCSDEFVDATVSCHRWDEGADPMEIVNNAVGSYRNYYFFNNYKRGRFGFDSYSLYTRVSSRYFNYLPNVYQHWLFRVAFYGIDDNTLSNYWTLGTYTGFNQLMQVISKPEYGTYCLADAAGECNANGEKWMQLSTDTTPTEDADKLVIGRGFGRRKYSRFDFDSGYYYQNQLVEAGHFWEHLAAIEALTNSSGVFVGVETGTDFTRYLVPYFIAFEDELTKYFEGIVTDNYAMYSPKVAGEKTIKVEPAAALTLTNGARLDPETGEVLTNVSFGRPIDLGNNFTLRFYTLVQGMSEFRSLYSLRFADRQQVFRMGTGEEVTPGAGLEVASCADPVGGHVYGTIRDPLVADRDEGSALKTIERCQAEADAYVALRDSAPNSSQTFQARARLSETVEWLNFLRGLYGVFGSNL